MLKTLTGLFMGVFVASFTRELVSRMFSGPSGKKLRIWESDIEIGTREDDKKQIFFVSDNGKGIDQQYHEKIFGIFDKLDAKSDGSGIGLALVKRIIELHDGSVWVEPEGAGKGNRFCFNSCLAGI